MSRISNGFGTGSNSNGQFWYGSQTNFPGFLYKKNVGVGGRRSTLFAAGGNIICNQETYLYNKYKPGQNGVGASTIANRRAKNRLATVCTTQKCFPCYNSLGQYSNYTHNPNGYIPCPYYPYTPKTNPPIPPMNDILVPGNVPANMDTTGLTVIMKDADDVISFIPISTKGMDYYFSGKNYGDSNDKIWMSSNFSFSFGTNLINVYQFYPFEYPAILFDYYDCRAKYVYASNVLTNSNSTIKYVRIVYNGGDYYYSGQKNYEILFVKTNDYQYMQFNCDKNTIDYKRYKVQNQITDGTKYINIFGDPNVAKTVSGGSYVIRSDLNGNNWQYFPNYHLDI